MKKIVIITGASSGIGREFALQFAKKKRNEIDELWLIARRRGELQKVAEKCSVHCAVLEGDLQKKSVRDQLEVLLDKEKPKVQLLFNGAGYGKIGQVAENKLEDVEGMTMLNVVALSAITRIVLPYMDQNAVIVNMASSAAFLPQPDFGVYAATKSFVLSFTRALRRECSKENIWVTAVCPGPVKTEFFQVAQEGKPSPWYKKFFYVDCKKMVSYTIKDVEKRKEISIYSIPMKILYLLSKVLPHRLLMKIISG